MNQLIARYRKESPVFNPQAGNVYKPFILSGDPASMQSYLVQLVGGTKQPGEFYNTDKNRWEPAMIPMLEAALESIPEKFERAKQDEMNRRNPPLTAMPSRLAEEKDRMEAQLQIAKEEVGFLEKEIEAAKKKKDPEPPAILPRKQWNTVKFNKEGVMQSIAGWKVAEDKGKKLLCIQDARSLFDGLPVWKFKSGVLRAIELESSYRRRKAIREEVETGKPRQPFKAPATPIYDHKSGTLKYPGYSEKVLEKINKTIQDET